MGIRILKGGMMTTVQDLGRYGYQSQGFSVSAVMVWGHFLKCFLCWLCCRLR